MATDGGRGTSCSHVVATNLRCDACGEFVGVPPGEWLADEGRTLSWAANWYKTRRHVIGEDGRALCHATTQTSVFPDGWQSDTYSVPAGDSPEVMALQPCGLCMRKVKR